MSEWNSWSLAVQILSGFYMAGVASVIQLTHYPCFAQIDRSEFRRFHAQHSSALGLIAGPAMCLELTSALWLARGGEWIWVFNAVAVVVLWIMTFLLSVPAHNQLATGFDEMAWRKLQRSHSWRTRTWTVRAVFLFVMLLLGLKGTV